MFTKAAALTALSAAAVAVPAMGYALSLPICVRYEKAVFRTLPPHLRGLKILHIADFHGRYPNKMHLDIWPVINSLDFDMAVFTGDVILDDVSQLCPHMKGLSALAKRVPVFYVDGNHEDKCYNEVAKLFRGIGAAVLFNHRGDFAVGHAETGCSPVVSIAGFRDYYYLQKSNFKGVKPLLKDLENRGGFHIILTHQPQLFDLICRAKNYSALMLAGHTHGGQVRLPFFPTLVAPGQGILPKYGDGWYEGANGRIKLFISRGIGATHFPLRLFNPPEVAVVELG